MNENSEATSSLCGYSEILHQQWVQLQIMGRALTPEEQARSQELRKLIDFIGNLVGFLGGSCPDIPAAPTPLPQPVLPPPRVPMVLKDGRFEGGNNEIFIELRIDEDGAGVISADLFRTGPSGRTYAASLRTAPAVAVRRAEGRWVIIASGPEGATATGTLSIEPRRADGTALTGELVLDSALNGLPVRSGINFAADWVSNGMRRLGVEIEREADIDGLPSFNFEGEEVTVRSSLRVAGFDVRNVGERSIIPTPSSKWGTTQLHTLMSDFAQAGLDRPLWELHLLLLGESTRSGLFGVMFDSSDDLPRQGAAIFSGEIEGRVSAGHFPRKLIQTTVHELGHALNLAHRFERPVGRADSTSFMNYDWRYKGGNQRDEYWSNFRFSFDADELEFLRHAPRHALIPGGAAFHSVNYWADGNGGYSPYVPEEPIDFLKLTLRPPTAGTLFDFAQPVFLEVELENPSNETYNFTPEILDPKSGLLEVLIRRRGGEGPADVFQPITERCFDISPDRMAALAPNGSLSNNLNLSFGSAGFPFAEPGEYDVTALLVFFDSRNERDLIVESNTLRIRVAFPHTRDEENDAQVLLRDDVGLYFALGGSRGLGAAHDALEDIRQRRQGRAKTIADPIVANIVRCAGIDIGRPYERFLQGRFEHSEGDRYRAAKLLGGLTRSVLRKTFDPHTAKYTELLAKKHGRAAKG
jgi:hypothetical protein